MLGEFGPDTKEWPFWGLLWWSSFSEDFALAGWSSDVSHHVCLAPQCPICVCTG